MRNNNRFVIRYRNIISALLLNILILAGAVCFSHLSFGTNDDRDISNLLANVYGHNNGYYIAFVNVIFTRAISYLYQFTNNVTNWYVLICIVASFGALVIISDLIIKRTTSFWVGLVLAFSLIAWLYKSHYIVFQFTHNATLYSMTGVLVLSDTFIEEWNRKSFVNAIIGIVFVLLGSLIRFQSLYFTLPYFLLVFVFVLFFHKGRVIDWSLFLKKWKPIIAIAISLLLALSARYIHLAVLNSPALNDYYEYNLLRAELLDYGLPDYEENIEAYSSMGITMEDAELFSAHVCLDNDVFSLETLQSLVALKTERATSYSFRNLSLRSLLSMPNAIKGTDENTFWIGLVLLFLFFLLCTNKSNYVLFLGSVHSDMIK